MPHFRHHLQTSCKGHRRATSDSSSMHEKPASKNSLRCLCLGPTKKKGVGDGSPCNCSCVQLCSCSTCACPFASLRSMSSATSTASIVFSASHRSFEVLFQWRNSEDDNAHCLKFEENKHLVFGCFWIASPAPFDHARSAWHLHWPHRQTVSQ